MKINQEIAKIDAIEFTHNENSTPIEKIISIWPLLKICLKIIKIFTGKKADKKIDEAIAIGDSIL